MRALTLAVSFCFASAALAAAETASPDRRADDMREMREALATLGAVMDAASRPSIGTGDAPRLLDEAVRRGTVDTEAMGAILRFVLHETEENVAAAFADALTAVEPRLQGLDSERYGAAARSVLSVFAGVLRDAQKNRRRDGASVLRELQPAIDAAAKALREVQAETAKDAPPEAAPERPLPHDR
jgi:hypothetical protein